MKTKIPAGLHQYWVCQLQSQDHPKLCSPKAHKPLKYETRWEKLCNWCLLVQSSVSSHIQAWKDSEESVRMECLCYWFQENDMKWTWLLNRICFRIQQKVQAHFRCKESSMTYMCAGLKTHDAPCQWTWYWTEISADNYVSTFNLSQEESIKKFTTVAYTAAHLQHRYSQICDLV